MRVEFFLEEESMKHFLEGFLPKILPDGFKLNENCFLRPFNGKSDLMSNLPRKFKTFNSNFYEPVKIVVLHDKDSNDCIQLKQSILDIHRTHSDVPILVRIVCIELESWYLGDMDALQEAFPDFNKERYQNKAKYRNPDILNGYDELKKIIPTFQKVAGAKIIGIAASSTSNKSESFNQFVSGLRRFLQS